MRGGGVRVGVAGGAGNVGRGCGVAGVVEVDVLGEGGAAEPGEGLRVVDGGGRVGGGVKGEEAGV